MPAGEFGNTSRGYILPCCYMDTPDLFDGDASFLVDEKFKLDNVESIDEIIESDVWQKFYDNLRNGIGPTQCHRTCGNNTAMQETK